MNEQETVLVVGATGYLGRYIVAELHRRGVRVRAVVRSRVRAEEEGAWGAPSLEGLVDEWAEGAVTDLTFTTELAKGVDRVISALGVTKQKADPWAVDYGANLNVLRSAVEHDVKSFCFVNVIGGDKCPAQLTKAKAAFVKDLKASAIISEVVNPPAYFSDMTEVFKMAQQGRVYLFAPEVRINPIHGADLAAFCVDRLLEGKVGEWNVGGPEVFTWREVATCAFEALGKPARISRVSPMVLKPLIGIMQLFNKRKADTLRFVSWSMTHDCMGQTTGTHKLLDFYTAQAR